MTDQEFSEFARVTKATTARWRDRGIGPTAMRLGHALRYDTREAVTWVLSGDSSI